MKFSFSMKKTFAKQIDRVIKIVRRAWLVWLSGLMPACKPKGRRFDSQSGHMPGF